MMGVSGVGSGFSASASGLRDSQLRMDVVANNVANSNTDGFVPDRVDSTASSGGGVSSQIVSSQSQPTVPNPTAYSQTDYATEGVSMIAAKRAYQANAVAIRARRDAERNLMDAFA